MLRSRRAPSARRNLLRAVALPVCAVALGTAATSADAALTLAAPVTSAALNVPEGVVLADVDRDGFDDAVVGTRDNLQRIQLFRGGADGFQAPSTIETGHNLPVAVGVGDFDEDGDLDVVSAAAVGGQSCRVAVLLGDGAGAFSPAPGSPFPTTTDGPSTGSALAVADITGDGHLDVLTGGDTELAVLPGDGDGGLGAARVVALGFSDLRSVAVGDFAGDARPDVMTGSGQPQTLSELYENVGGTLTFRSLRDDTGNEVVAGDIDGRGRDDLTGSRLNGSTLATLLSTGDGLFTDPALETNAGMFFVAGMALADVDADGRTDLAVAGADFVELMAGDGAGAFASFPGSPIPSVGANNSTALGDVTGDAQPDLVASNGDADTLTLVRNLNTAAASGPPSVDFGTVAAGAPAVERTVTLTSGGPGFYRVRAASAVGAGGVAIASDSCSGRPLAVGATCAITLRFTPGAAGSLAGSLALVDNTPAGGRSIALGATVTGAGGGGGGGGNPVPPGGRTAPDRARPVLGALRLSPATFAVGAGATAKVAARRAARVKRGTTIRFTLSEAARVTLRIERRTRGLRKGTRCLVPTSALRRAKAKRCTRFVTAGTLVRRGARRGQNAVAFSGRIGRAALRPGRYRVTASAADAAGNAGARAPRAAFTVVGAR